MSVALALETRGTALNSKAVTLHLWTFAPKARTQRCVERSQTSMRPSLPVLTKVFPSRRHKRRMTPRLHSLSVSECRCVRRVTLSMERLEWVSGCRSWGRLTYIPIRSFQDGSTWWISRIWFNWSSESASTWSWRRGGDDTETELRLSMSRCTRERIRWIESVHQVGQ